MFRRTFLASAAALALYRFWPAGGYSGPMKTRLNLDATFLTNFPAQPWLTQISHAASGAFTGDFAGLYWHQLNYQVCGRWKRCFVIQPTLVPPHVISGVTYPGTKPILFVGLPGSNNNSDGDGNGLNDGAWDLTENIGPGEIQFQWPLRLVKDQGVFAVLIDGPLFGAYPYNPPDIWNMSPVDSLVDDICGVEAARWFLTEHPSFRYYGNLGPGMPTFVGGLSWGAARAQFLIAALRDCVLGYVAGGQISKEYDIRPPFCPPDWASAGVDYADMLKASKAKKIRIMYGANGLDYLYTPFSTGNPADPTKTIQRPIDASGTLSPPIPVPNVDYVLAGLTAFAPAKFSVKLSAGMGHQIDLPDILSWFDTNKNLLIHTMPEYDPAG